MELKPNSIFIDFRFTVSSNRTFMELKRILHVDKFIELFCSNRTFMELKRTNGAEQRQTGRCSNRTFMELKQRN